MRLVALIFNTLIQSTLCISYGAAAFIHICKSLWRYILLRRLRRLHPSTHTHPHGHSRRKGGAVLLSPGSHWDTTCCSCDLQLPLVQRAHQGVEQKHTMETLAWNSTWKTAEKTSPIDSDFYFIFKNTELINRSTLNFKHLFFCAHNKYKILPYNNLQRGCYSTTEIQYPDLHLKGHLFSPVMFATPFCIHQFQLIWAWLWVQNDSCVTLGPCIFMSSY